LITEAKHNYETLEIFVPNTYKLTAKPVVSNNRYETEYHAANSGLF